MMAKFGHVNQPKRFDKTRRAMNKLIPKPPRGELRPRPKRAEQSAVTQPEMD
jgi:hypothetical protein